MSTLPVTLDRSLGKTRTGNTHGLWLVVGQSPVLSGSSQHLRWLCRCTCGKERLVREDTLIAGRTSSCGCINRRRESHGLSRTKAYAAWNRLLRRCRNPEDAGYANYGGRGIAVCDRWLSVEKFVEDMGEPEAGLSIERLDNSKGYSKDNCVWASRSKQNRNMRTTRLGWEKVRDIRTFPERYADAARRYEVSVGCIRDAAQNITWTDENYVPPKLRTRGNHQRVLGHYIGPARTLDKQEPNHDL